MAGALRIDRSALQDDRVAAMSDDEFRAHLLAWIRWGRDKCGRTPAEAGMILRPAPEPI